MGARSGWTFRFESSNAGTQVLFVATTFFGGTGATPQAVQKNAGRLEQKLALLC